MKLVTLNLAVIILRTTFNLPLAAFGQANVKNLSMALGVGLRSGVSFELLQKRLYDWKPSPLRGKYRYRVSKYIMLIAIMPILSQCRRLFLPSLTVLISYQNSMF